MDEAKNSLKGAAMGAPREPVTEHEVEAFIARNRRIAREQRMKMQPLLTWSAAVRQELEASLQQARRDPVIAAMGEAAAEMLRRRELELQEQLLPMLEGIRSQIADMSKLTRRVREPWIQTLRPLEMALVGMFEAVRDARIEFIVLAAEQEKDNGPIIDSAEELDALLRQHRGG